jgi:hypothetical protein
MLSMFLGCSTGGILAGVTIGHQLLLLLHRIQTATRSAAIVVGNIAPIFLQGFPHQRRIPVFHPRTRLVRREWGGLDPQEESHCPVSPAGPLPVLRQMGLARQLVDWLHGLIGMCCLKCWSGVWLNAGAERGLVRALVVVRLHITRSRVDAVRSRIVNMVEVSIARDRSRDKHGSLDPYHGQLKTGVDGLHDLQVRSVNYYSMR